MVSYEEGNQILIANGSNYVAKCNLLTDNEQVCHEALEILARDLSIGVRLGVAVNPNTSIGILTILTMDEATTVSEQARGVLKDRDVLSELLDE